MKRVKNKEYQKMIPKEISVLFGKFYVYSFLMILFFLLIYPFFLIERLSRVSLIGILIVGFFFYLYVVLDVKKKKKQFSSSFFFILIFVVLSSILFSLAKLMG